MRPCSIERPERLSAFSDAVFAVLITVMVLLQGAAVALAHMAQLRRELPFHRHRMDQPPLPMRNATETTPSLLWFNFAHLFSISLLPVSTTWMAVSELAPQPVAFYAAVFFLVNATYVLLIWELIDRRPAVEVSPRVRKIMHFRSLATLCLFGFAAIVALGYPAWTRNLYFVPGRLSKAHSAGSGGSKISCDSEATGSRTHKCLTFVSLSLPALIARRPTGCLLRH